MSIAEEILLKDSASGPAGKIASALGRVNRELDRLVATSARVRNFGPDLERAMGIANRTKGAASLTDKITLEEAKRASKIATTEAAAAAKQKLADAKAVAARQLADQKAAAALELEQAKAAGQLAVQQAKAAMQTERLAAASARAAAARSGAAGAVGGIPARGRESEDTSAKLDSLKTTLGTVAATLAVIGGAVAAVTTAFLRASLSAAEFRNNTLAGLKAMLGSKAAAEDMYASIKQFAKESPFGKEEVAASFKSLLGAGFSKEMTQDILSGLFDVSALNNFNRDVISKLTLTIAQIKAKGKLQGEELLQLAEGSGGQISIERVNAEIARAIGKTPAEVQKMISAGAVKSDVAIKAILEVIRTNLSGGKLGALAKELGAQSLEGLGSTLKDFVTDMFELVDIGPLKKMLASLVGVLSGPEGDKLTSAITRLGTALFDGLFGGLDKGDQLTRIVGGIADAVTFVAEAIEMAAPYMKALGEGVVEGFGDVGKVLKDIFGGKSFDKKPIEGLVELFKTAGKGIAFIVSAVAGFAVAVGEGFVFLTAIIGGIVGVIGSVISAVMSAISAIQTFVGSVMGSSGQTMGTALTNGVVTGILKGTPAVAQAASSMASSATSAASGTWQVASPSKVFTALGGFLAAGAAVGIAKGTPMLERASADMARAGISAAAAPLNDNASGGAVLGAPGAGAVGGGGGASMSVTIEQTITVGGGVSPEQVQAVRDAAEAGAQAGWEAAHDRYMRKRLERAA